MAEKWTKEKLACTARDYQKACVLLAAVDLNIFSILKAKGLSAQVLARKIKVNVRGIKVLLDALVALELVEKQDENYNLTAEAEQFLTDDSDDSILPGLRHHANCFRRWVQLPNVIINGRPAERFLNIHNESEVTAAFIGAMNNFSAPMAAEVISGLGKLNFKHLLDVGGASGTWTIEFLRAVPKAKATIFDLPEVIELAKKRIAGAQLSDRIELVAGDFYEDELPKGADFVWLSAIAHQNSRQENRRLFSKIFSALDKEGRLVIRDVVMNQSHTQPIAGALFAVNMLVGTEGGGTYSFEEYCSDLESCGFKNVTLVKQTEAMNSIISAEK
jgi:precorrin-6B methylase 2